MRSDADGENEQEFPGKAPLTEIETKLAADLAKKNQLNLFVSVHSGSEAILSSPAYRLAQMKDLPEATQAVLKTVHRHHCPECSLGPASSVLPYLANGCLMDYMFDLSFKSESNPTHPIHDHFSFTYETWQGDKHKKLYENLGKKSSENDLEEEEEIRQQEVMFDHVMHSVGSREMTCLRRFNPPPREFENIRERWTKALFTTLTAVEQHSATQVTPTEANQMSDEWINQ
eukprot:c9861_g1_i2.p1 GENE.c9861_g1_i2~~c9861_g1_i2.p1  ORF type:complete len:230 (+),score=56.79 c9861_g1_i2:131-820(+)